MVLRYKMALPCRSNVKSLFQFILKTNLPKRFLCAGGNVNVKVVCLFSCKTPILRNLSGVSYICTLDNRLCILARIAVDVKVEVNLYVQNCRDKPL